MDPAVLHLQTLLAAGGARGAQASERVADQCRRGFRLGLDELVGARAHESVARGRVVEAREDGQVGAQSAKPLHGQPRAIGLGQEQVLLQARAQPGVAVGQFYPQAQQAFGSLTYNRQSARAPFSTGGPASLLEYWQNQIGLQAAWEMDFWGRFRRGRRRPRRN